MIKFLFALFAGILLNSGIALSYNETIDQNDPISLYFASLNSLIKEENWEEIITLGEKALQIAEIIEDEETEFKILDTLVSIYFRLGDFIEAKIKAERLVLLGISIDNSELVVESLYKLSAVIRAEANNYSAFPDVQQNYFAEAKVYANMALEMCPNNQFLKAKVLFNLGAAIADNPMDNQAEALSVFNEALDLFEQLREEDYRLRTMIRLGKVYLSMNDLSSAQAIVDQLQWSFLDGRTKMHFLYLGAQVSAAAGNWTEACDKAKEGRMMAIILHAKADLERFDAFIKDCQDCMQSG